MALFAIFFRHLQGWTEEPIAPPKAETEQEILCGRLNWDLESDFTERLGSSEIIIDVL
jgi:hypothetical protein